MIKLFVDRNPDGSRWRLVSRTDCASDVIARSCAPLPPGTSALTQLALLSKGSAPRLCAGEDGHWQWRIATPDGRAVAESPPIFRDPVACREALADARRAAATLLRPARGGDTRHDAAGTTA